MNFWFPTYPSLHDSRIQLNEYWQGSLYIQRQKHLFPLLNHEDIAQFLDILSGLLLQFFNQPRSVHNKDICRHVEEFICRSCYQRVCATVTWSVSSISKIAFTSEISFLCNFLYTTVIGPSVVLCRWKT